MLKIKLILVFLISSSLLFSYVAKIANKEISKSKFQEFINIQKFIANKKTFNELAEFKKTDRNGILSEYIDQVIVVKEAKKKGYKTDSRKVNKIFKTKKKRWLLNLYTTRHVDFTSLSIKEKDLKKAYKRLPANSRTKSYKDLSDEEKRGLYQIATINKAQNQKKNFQKKLEKKYKVKRYKLSSKTVAKVGKINITKKKFQNSVDEQLARIGLNEKIIAARDPKRLEEAKKDILEEIIFEELAKLDMEKTGFLKNKLLRSAYVILRDQIITELFIINEIASNVKVSDQELDQAFVVVSKQNPSIKNMLPTEQERILRDFILQKKMPKILTDYLSEVKEGIVIKRNKVDLRNIK